MATVRLSEYHRDGEVVERVELTDDSGALLYVRTNPSNGDEVLESRAATGDEVRLTSPPTDPDEELREAIEGATDFASLKAALLGKNRAAAAKGKLKA